MASGLPAATLARLEKQYATLPKEILTGIREANVATVDSMVDQARAIAPVDPNSPNPGALRDSYHREDGKGSPTAVAFVGGAPGFPAIAHAEWGHTAADGSHVKAEPVFNPIVRKNIKAGRSRAMAAARKAGKVLVSGS
jgi:hypothetical protein